VDLELDRVPALVLALERVIGRDKPAFLVGCLVAVPAIARLGDAGLVVADSRVHPALRPARQRPFAMSEPEISARIVLTMETS
jgi:hypothetical protein